jgi:pimeloyl-ACP methyl ester carboxylesterase
MVVGNPDLGAVITPEEASRVGQLAGAKVIALDDVGHLVHDQKPEAWLAAVNGWVGQVLTGG